jgi:hypothetical protein
MKTKAEQLIDSIVDEDSSEDPSITFTSNEDEQLINTNAKKVKYNCRRANELMSYLLADVDDLVSGKMNSSDILGNAKEMQGYVNRMVDLLGKM